MQSVRRTERHPHSEKHAFIIPNFGEEIFPFVQPDAMERKAGIDALVNIFGQTFGRHRAPFRSGHLFVEMTMIELGAQGVNTCAHKSSRGWAIACSRSCGGRCAT